MQPITELLKRARWLIVVALAIGVAVLVLASRDREQASAIPPPELTGAPTKVVAQAQVVPIDGIIEVRPLTDGRVLRVLVQPGDRVEAQQLLAEIESEIQTAAVDQREADVKAAAERLRLVQEGVRVEDRAGLVAAAEAARNEAELARDRWERQKRLFEQGFVSEQSVLELQRGYAVADARRREALLRAQAGKVGGRPGEVRAAREQVTAASAALDVTKVQLARTRIVAPVAGVVMTRNVNPGDIIGANVTSPTLFKIVDPVRLEVRMEVEELMAAAIVPGLTVKFMLPGSSTLAGNGKVVRVAPQVEKRTIGADDARIRADSMIRPAWAEFVPLPTDKTLPPINYRLEAWIELQR